MTLCKHVHTNDRRASTRRIVIPVTDLARIVTWRLVLAGMDRIGLTVKPMLAGTHPLRLWAWERFLIACLSSRNLLWEDSCDNSCDNTK